VDLEVPSGTVDSSAGPLAAIRTAAVQPVKASFSSWEATTLSREPSRRDLDPARCGCNRVQWFAVNPASLAIMATCFQ
jgi:hypothetical protein